MPGSQLSWEFSSDVCKHCENAGCLEACPTGAIVRTEFGGVFVQPDVCNGCGYCVVACPFGVVQRNPEDGRAFKCTFCYDRQKVGLQPACATGVSDGVDQVRPARSSCRLVAQERVEELQARGMDDACVYDPHGHQRRRAFTRSSSCAAIRGNTICRRIPRSRRSTTEGGLDEFRRCRGPAAVRQPFRLSGERETMSSNPHDSVPHPEHTDWARENRLLEIRREAERKGHVEATGVRRAGRAFSHGFARDRLLRRSAAERAAVDLGDSAVLLRRRRCRIGGGALARSRTGSAATEKLARDCRLHRRRRRDCLQRIADLRSRTSGAISRHDASLQAAESDVGRRLDAGGIRQLLRRCSVCANCC